MRKKYGTQLFLLTMVLALCAGAYLGLRWWNAGAEDRAAAQADYLARLEDLSALSFQRGETSLSFTRDGELIAVDPVAERHQLWRIHGS